MSNIASSITPTADTSALLLQVIVNHPGLWAELIQEAGRDGTEMGDLVNSLVKEDSGSAEAAPVPASDPEYRLPDDHADRSPIRMLQVKVPSALHWNFKQAAAHRGTDMSHVVLALIGLYTYDSKLLTRVMAIATERRISLGQLLNGVLNDVVRADGQRNS